VWGSFSADWNCSAMFTQPWLISPRPWRNTIVVDETEEAGVEVVAGLVIMGTERGHCDGGEKRPAQAGGL